MSIPSDNPIRSKSDDVLDRAKYAEDFVSIIRDVDVSEGAIIGIVGSWGSGKTSFINLVREHLKSEKLTTQENSPSDVQMIDFNPWLFSGTEDLVRIFLTDLSSSLAAYPRYRDVAESLVEYIIPLCDLISCLAGSSPIGTAFRRFVRRSQRRRSVAESKKQVEDKLREKTTTRLVVVIDDIDRLSASEVREMFRCIRLVAAFPNTIYVATFDWNRTVQALDDTVAKSFASGEDEPSWGKDYLEKIIQVKYNMPEINLGILHKQCERELIKALNRPVETSSSLYRSTRDKIVKPLVYNMRHVRRLASAVRTKTVIPNESIPVPYLIAFETIRLVLPETFDALCRSVDSLTRSADGSPEDATCRWHVERIVKSAKDKSDIVRDFLLMLFPTAFDYLVTNRTTENLKMINDAITTLQEYGISTKDNQKQILELYLGM